MTDSQSAHTPTTEKAHLTDDEWDDLADRIIAVRDRYERTPNDADTDAIIEEAILPFLAGQRAKAWDEGATKASEYGGAYLRSILVSNPYRDPLGTLRERLSNPPAPTGGAS